MVRNIFTGNQQYISSKRKQNAECNVASMQVFILIQSNADFISTLYELNMELTMELTILFAENMLLFACYIIYEQRWFFWASKLSLY